MVSISEPYQFNDLEVVDIIADSKQELVAFWSQYITFSGDKNYDDLPSKPPFKVQIEHLDRAKIAIEGLENPGIKFWIEQMKFTDAHRLEGVMAIIFATQYRMRGKDARTQAIHYLNWFDTWQASNKGKTFTMEPKHSFVIKTIEKVADFNDSIYQLTKLKLQLELVYELLSA